MPVIIGVRFKPVGKMYYFSPDGQEFAVGDGVIVETARGVEYGKVVMDAKEVDEKSVVQPLKPVMRRATEKDTRTYQRNIDRKPDAMKVAEEKIKKHNLAMKLVDAEFTFDGSKVIFYFTAEGRVDFRELVRDLAGHFRMRIELRQIGIRDEAKTLGGIAPCGRGCCCSQHLGDFEHVSIKMAKTQGLSLNPTKISGLCGRLMCCLSYENQHYAEVFKQMPRLGSEVTTPDGKGLVFSNNMLKKLVKVKVELPDKTFSIREYPLDDIKTKVKQAVPEDGPEDAEAADILND